MISPIGPFTIIEKALVGFTDGRGQHRPGALELRIVPPDDYDRSGYDIQGSYKNRYGELMWVTLVTFPIQSRPK